MPALLATAISSPSRTKTWLRCSINSPINSQPSLPMNRMQYRLLLREEREARERMKSSVALLGWVAFVGGLVALALRFLPQEMMP